ncbi:hypothetical protein BJX64DRAFT_14024 [Aspergillus heterothallicus]
MASGSTHPFNTKLPSEICGSIFEFAVGGKIRECGYAFPLEIKGWRLVNRSWNSYLTPLFYSSFVFHNNPNTIATLWRFLRLVVLDSEKAGYVQQLTFTAMELEVEFNPRNASDVLFDIYTNVVDVWFNEPIDDLSDLDAVRRQLNKTYLTAYDTIKPKARSKIRDLYYRALFQKNRHWLTGVMDDIGFDQAGHVGEGMNQRAERMLFKGDAYSGYHCPLVAIILAHCTNVRELNMSVWPSREDRWLDTILGHATERWPGTPLPLKSRPLQQLQYLSIAPKPDRSFIDKVTNTPCVVDNHRPYLRLPNLKEFNALHCEVDKSIFENTAPTKITALTINGPEFDRVHLAQVLKLTPQIRHLSLSLSGEATAMQTGALRPTRLKGPAFYTELWKILLPLKDQLEYLDLHQNHMAYNTYRAWFLARQDISTCAPLAQFPKLRHLNVPILVMAGHNRCPHPSGDTTNPNAHFLTAHLPPNIESLGLYTGGSELLATYLQDYESCLADIASSKKSPHIRAIVLDNMTGAKEDKLHDAKLERAASRAGIFYQKQGGLFLLYGGWEAPFARTCVRSRTVTQLKIVQIRRGERPGLVIPFGMKVSGFEGKLVDGRKRTAAAAGEKKTKRGVKRRATRMA